MPNKQSALITNTLEIYNLLKNIEKSKQLIAISFDSLPKHCLTSLLDVRHDTKVLIFDEPHPQLSSTLLTTKKEAVFTLKLDNLPVKFKTNFLLNNNKENNFNDLYAPFPEEIHYPQKRRYYRFCTELIDEIETTIFFSAKRKLPCKLINISLNGFRLHIPFSFASMFQINQQIDDIYIQLPEQNGFSISASIKNARIENNYTSVALGLEIKQQKPAIEKIIQQFIFRSKSV
jgi:c-di-GMP-binding flagellar brake protein YcgR